MSELSARAVTLAIALNLLPAAHALAAEPFATGMVSITFDDSELSQYTLGAPALEARGYRGTYYLITQLLTSTSYIDAPRARDLAARGHEVASHTITHPHLTTLSDATLTTELQQSQRDLLAAVPALSDVPSFASPYGEYDDRVVAELAKYYQSHRTVDRNYTYRDSDRLRLGGFGCDRNTTLTEQFARIDRAAADGTWVILFFHQLTDGPPKTLYACSVQDLATVLDYIQQLAIPVVTVAEGVAMMSSTSSLRPTITSVSPASGPATGGTSVTVAGTNLTGAAVSFGGTQATNVTVASDGLSLTCTTPAHAAGAVSVVVTTPDGSASSGFTYLASTAPTVGALSPTSGPYYGGTTVTLTGTNLTGASVTFGGTSATNVAVATDGRSLTCTAPAHDPGSVQVTVTTPNGAASITGFGYVALQVQSVRPNRGPPVGGTDVTIRGTSFAASPTVTFAGVQATNVTRVNDTTITCRTPAGTSGARVDVRVTNADGRTAVLTGGFTYAKR